VGRAAGSRGDGIDRSLARRLRPVLPHGLHPAVPTRPRLRWHRAPMLRGPPAGRQRRRRRLRARL